MNPTVALQGLGGFSFIFGVRFMVQLPQKEGRHGQQREWRAAACSSFGRKEKASASPETAGDFRQAQCNYRREKLIGNNNN